jgi:hypothetical protein
MFTGQPWKDRQIEFQTHRVKECGKTPPGINEGITELQWAEIDKMSRRSQSVDGNSIINLISTKWKQIWSVLFPGVEAPHPCEFYFS